jgi:hypothetical protein
VSRACVAWALAEVAVVTGPLRAQVIVALVCVAMLIAVLCTCGASRRPKRRFHRRAPSASASGLPGALKAPAAAAAAPAPRLTLGAVQKVRCGRHAVGFLRPTVRCATRSLPSKEALKKAIVISEECAPKAKTKGSINFVLTVDFAHKKLHVFPVRAAIGTAKWRAARPLREQRRQNRGLERAPPIPSLRDRACSRPTRAPRAATSRRHRPHQRRPRPTSSPTLPTFE